MIVHPEFMADPEFQADRALNLSMIPSMWFSGYHPDCCYVFGNDGIVNGPMDAYHSVIVLAAYKLGIPAD